MKNKNDEYSFDKDLFLNALENATNEVRKIIEGLLRINLESIIKLPIGRKESKFESFRSHEILCIYSIDKKYYLKTRNSKKDQLLNQNFSETFDSMIKEKMDHCFYKGKSGIINLAIIEELMINDRKTQSYVKRYLKHHFPELKGINIKELFKAFDSYRLKKIQAINNVNKLTHQ